MVLDRKVEPTSVVLANRPRLFRELLRHALEAVPGVQVVGEVEDAELVKTVLKRQRADWLIVALTPGETLPASVEWALARQPDLCVLALASDASRALCQVRGEPGVLHSGISFEQLVDLMKSHGCRQQHRPASVTEPVPGRRERGDGQPDQVKPL